MACRHVLRMSIVHAVVLRAGVALVRRSAIACVPFPLSLWISAGTVLERWFAIVCADFEVRHLANNKMHQTPEHGESQGAKVGFSSRGTKQPGTGHQDTKCKLIGNICRIAPATVVLCQRRTVLWHMFASRPHMAFLNVLDVSVGVVACRWCATSSVFLKAQLPS